MLRFKFIATDNTLPFSNIAMRLQRIGKHLLNASILSSMSVFVSAAAEGLSAPANTQSSPVDLVYPYLDTANSRWFFFSSAARPFGMVSLFPDTEQIGEWGSGYRYNSTTVHGFNHIHEWQLAGLSVMPVSTSMPLTELKHDYTSNFDRKTETVSPGYHQLRLTRYQLDVALTATSRVGFHQYQYAKGQPQQVLFQLGGLMGPSQLGHAEAWQQDQYSVAGYITNQGTERRTKPVKVYFYARFQQPIQQLDAWRGDMLFSNVQGVNGDNAGILLTLAAQHEPTLMKVAISYVSTENAKLNMDTELPGWDFNATQQAARAEWHDWLSKIQIHGGTEQQQRRFYTDLWHALQGRRAISDVNGQYPDNSGLHFRVGQLPMDAAEKPKFNQHNSDSFWGAQWTIATLWPLAYPQIASDMGNSLLQYYKDSGHIPRGPSGGQDTLVMTGAPTTPFLVSNYQKGLRDFDVALAYEAMKKSHSLNGVMARAGYEHYSSTGGGMRYYLERGYIPYPLPLEESNYGSHRRGPGQTLEYSFQDHTLAQLAKALGNTSDYNEFSRRALNYRNQFDQQSGYMRPRNMDGSWQTPFDPFEYENGFVEANAAQGTWFVPHDIAGLAKLMGGKDKLIRTLNSAFEVAEQQGFTAGTAHAYETHPEYRRIPINYGNQPSMQSAFIFSAAGAPWLTQYWSRRIVDTVYSDLSPDRGYNGDEDQGLMGSLAVLMKIGLFQLTGGTEADPIYYIGSPLFDEINITLDPKYYAGQKFVIKTLGNGADRPYVQSIKLNGKPLERTFLRHSEIIAGGTLELIMSDKPNMNLKD